MDNKMDDFKNFVKNEIDENAPVVISIVAILFPLIPNDFK